MWRAATFMLTGAVIVLAYFNADAQQRANQMTRYVIDLLTPNQVRDLAGFDFDFQKFVGNPAVKTKSLRSDKADFPGMAVVYFHEGEKDVFVLGMGLPEGGDAYTVRVVNPDGSTTDQGTAHARAGFLSIRITDVAVNALGALTWEIVNSDNDVVLRSA